jgi:hypothetical protein
MTAVIILLLGILIVAGLLLDRANRIIELLEQVLRIEPF